MAQGSFKEADYTRVKRGLGEAIRSTRSCAPQETARMLLSYDTEGNRLAGLLSNGEAVVYYFEARNAPVRIAFDTTGLDERGGLEMAYVGNSREFHRWVCKMAPDSWAWIHPRYECKRV